MARLCFAGEWFAGWARSSRCQTPGWPRPLLKEGDVVLFSRYAGTDIEVDGEKVLIMREAEVIGIVQ